MGSPRSRDWRGYLFGVPVEGLLGGDVWLASCLWRGKLMRSLCDQLRVELEKQGGNDDQDVGGVSEGGGGVVGT